MRHLFLMRHAKTRQASGSMSDHQRPLRRRGQRQAAAMAVPLMRWGALEGDIHLSSAQRTRETLEAIDACLPDLDLCRRAACHDALYTFDGQALVDCLRRLPHSAERVLLIGHNPALLELARWLCRDAPDALPTGGLLHLELPGAPWPALTPRCARLAASLVPDTASHALFQRRAPAPPDLGDADFSTRLQGQLDHLYQLVRALEPGVMAGVDPEFLHQYRVNLRRSRAIVESVQATARQAGSGKIPGLKRQLKHLKRRAQATSDLRDLDVFLESLENTPPSLPSSVRRALQRWLHARRREQHEALCRALRDPGYAGEMQSWQGFLDGKAFRQTLDQLSSKRIESVLAERVAGHDRELAALSPEAPDEAFHDLRKTVKRIRYLAELAPKRHRRFLKGLKRRQTLLGDFQDLCTREAWLEAFLASESAPETAAAVIAWRETLEMEKLALREKVMALPPLTEE